MRDWLELIANTAGLIWFEAFVGSAIIVAGIPVGWRLSRRPRLWPVRFMRWWVANIVTPLLASRSWAKRAAIIATNNVVMLGLTVLSGAVPLLAWLFVAWVGVALGIALHLMVENTDLDVDEDQSQQAPSLLFTLGMALNLLEPPAIMGAAGLALAQGALTDKLSLAVAAKCYAVVFVPLLLAAAAGESLWMGQRRLHG